MTPTTAIKESANVSFSLSFLLQLFGVLMAGVWGYSQLDARISTISNASAQHTEGIDRIEDAMALNQDAPISSDHTQNSAISNLSAEAAYTKARIDIHEQRIYDLTGSRR